MTSRAMTTADNQLMQIKRTMAMKKEELVAILGDSREAERLVMSALMVAADSQAVLKCDPHTVVRCAIQAALLGLDLAAGLGQAYLVPFGGQCTLMIGYRGWVAKASEAGYTIVAEPVYENDYFEFTKMPMHVEHAPKLNASVRGGMLGVYAVALMGATNTIAQVTWVTMEDITKARALADAKRKSPAWRDWFDRMARKLAISRLVKDLAPGSGSALSKVLEVDSLFDKGGGLDRDADSIDSIRPRIEDKLAPGAHRFGFGAAEPEVIEPTEEEHAAAMEAAAKQAAEDAAEGGAS